MPPLEGALENSIFKIREKRIMHLEGTAYS